MTEQKSQHLVTGKKAEDRAALFLMGKEYDIIDRNYRYKRGEIDIIARKDNLLIFVEVKFRKGVYFGFPEEAVTEKKARKVIETAENFIFENDWKGRIRFDIISLTGDKEIVHFEDAF